jgi:O-antigen/teichoic acid export membrane protein
VLATLSGTTAVTAIVVVQALVLAPLFLRELGAPLYGAWLASGELLVWILAFDLGLPNLLIQRIGAAHARGDVATVGEYLAAGLLVLAVIGLGLAAAVVVVAPLVPALMGLSGEDAHALRSVLRVAGIATAALVTTNAVVGFSRGIQQTGLISAASVLSVLCGFLVTLALLLSGWGLWAAAAGVVARATILVLGAAWFVWLQVRRQGLAAHVRIRWRACRELLAISPVTAAGGLAYAGMTQSETALVAILGRPDLAAAYALTRRAGDLARVLIDVIGMASYGSFAHLVASSERSRSLAVHAEVSSLRLSLAVTAAGAYVAVNASLVTVWVGEAQYLGLAATVAFAVQMVAVGQAYLMNYLYRATGAVAKGSWLLVAESLLRIPLMVILFQWMGVVGIPLAGVLTAIGFGSLALAWTCRELADTCPARPTASVTLHLARGAVLGAGVMIGAAWYQPTWPFALFVPLLFAAVSFPLQAAFDPLIRETISGVRAMLQPWPARLSK